MQVKELIKKQGIMRTIAKANESMALQSSGTQSEIFSFQAFVYGM